MIMQAEDQAARTSRASNGREPCVPAMSLAPQPEGWLKQVSVGYERAVIAISACEN
jgi:hypothetical protein